MVAADWNLYVHWDKEGKGYVPQQLQYIYIYILELYKSTIIDEANKILYSVSIII